jgi:hypothetical protein
MESECGRNAQQIVSYRDIQTERKGGFELLAAGAIEIDAEQGACCLRADRASSMVNRKLTHCA